MVTRIMLTVTAEALFQVNEKIRWAALTTDRVK
jgi:hypothetical protein